MLLTSQLLIETFVEPPSSGPLQETFLARGTTSSRRRPVVFDGSTWKWNINEITCMFKKSLNALLLFTTYQLLVHLMYNLMYICKIIEQEVKCLELVQFEILIWNHNHISRQWGSVSVTVVTNSLKLLRSKNKEEKLFEFHLSCKLEFLFLLCSGILIESDNDKRTYRSVGVADGGIMGYIRGKETGGEARPRNRKVKRW